MPSWCGREDLNLHPLQDYHLKVARLPIPPRPHIMLKGSFVSYRTYCSDALRVYDYSRFTQSATSAQILKELVYDTESAVKTQVPVTNVCRSEEYLL